MRDDIKTHIKHIDSIIIISLDGDITTFSETAINDAYREAEEQNATKILLDFKNVNYINSAGIAVLIGVVTESRKQDKKLAFSGLTPHFQKIFKMVGLTQYASTYDDENAALASLRS